MTERITTESEQAEIEELKKNEFKRRPVIGVTNARDSNGRFLAKLSKFIDIKKTRRGISHSFSNYRGDRNHLDILN